ncbi:hypothetical protein V4F39_01720 [Aquincola sp. MAHUQ-54]|uniref:CMP/dCMP-type deaminase domain-containing protein n=1 Tax=Aquincola agrisoli TaxID=3119538 RepID=A0AAW9PZQ9_9BURK
MTKLAEFMQGDFGTDNVAGYLSGGKTNRRFNYFRSSSAALPAFVNALEAAGRAKVYTNLDPAPWPKHIVQNIKGKASLQLHEGDGALEVTPAEQAVRKWPSRVISTSGAAPVGGGGLHAAARGLMTSATLAAEGSRERGLQRALRYYMLATYALVDISGEESFKGLNNYIGAMLVGDDGAILAAGINTGSYRHAEVSMLLSYFRSHPTATALPAKSVVFSTLTPCKQCTAYLTAVKASDTVIYFGQKDTGKDGRAGEKIGKQLSEKTSAPHGRSKTALTGTVPDEGGLGVVATGTASGIHKVAIDQGLTSCMGSGSIAGQIGEAGDSREILRSTSDALIHKTVKDRSGSDAEAQLKQAVLTYVTGWLGRVTLAA